MSGGDDDAKAALWELNSWSELEGGDFDASILFDVSQAGRKLRVQVTVAHGMHIDHQPSALVGLDAVLFLEVGKYRLAHNYMAVLGNLDETTAIDFFIEVVLDEPKGRLTLQLAGGAASVALR